MNKKSFEYFYPAKKKKRLEIQVCGTYNLKTAARHMCAQNIKRQKFYVTYNFYT